MRPVIPIMTRSVSLTGRPDTEWQPKGLLDAVEHLEAGKEEDI